VCGESELKTPVVMVAPLQRRAKFCPSFARKKRQWYQQRRHSGKGKTGWNWVYHQNFVENLVWSQLFRYVKFSSSFTRLMPYYAETNWVTLWITLLCCNFIVLFLIFWTLMISYV
jgi:hypothetical protein